MSSIKKRVVSNESMGHITNLVMSTHMSESRIGASDVRVEKIEESPGYT